MSSNGFSGSVNTDHSPLRHFLEVLRRRKFILLQAVILMPLVAAFASMQVSPTYEASAEVLLQNQDLAGALSGTGGSGVFTDPERIAETQARIASTPEVAARTLAGTGATTYTLPVSVTSVVKSRTTAPFRRSAIRPAYNTSILFSGLFQSL